MSNAQNREMGQVEDVTDDEILDACNRALDACWRMCAVLSGGDWTDASVQHVLVTGDVNIDREKEKWRSWYTGEYCKALSRGEKPRYLTLTDWLVERCGGRYATDSELTIVDDST
jgi:hypothetical protein